MMKENEAINVCTCQVTFLDMNKKKQDFDGNPICEKLVRHPLVKCVHSVVAWVDGKNGLEFLGTEKYTRNGVEDFTFKSSFKNQPQGNFNKYCE